MGKKSFPDEGKMSDASYIDQAAAWTADLVRWESRGWGDDDNARRRLARKSSTPYSLWRKLAYERDRVAGIYHDRFEKLRAFYIAECERHEAIAKAKRAGALKLRDMPDAADSGAGTAHPMADGGGASTLASRSAEESEA